METYHISIQSLPKIIFAHEYVSDNYDISFDKAEDFLEISYLIAGDILLCRENHTETIPAGSIMVACRRKPERAYALTRQQHITVGFHAKLAEQGELVLPNYMRSPGNERFYRRLHSIVEEFTLCQKTTLRLNAMLFDLLSEIDSEYRSVATPNTRYSELRYTEAAKRYVITHIREKIYVADIAGAVGLSVGYLSNIFRRTTGQTLIEYVNITKLELVKRLTQTEGLSVREAGEAYGYSDENYVSRIYKKYFGQTITSSGSPHSRSVQTDKI